MERKTTQAPARIFIRPEVELTCRNCKHYDNETIIALARHFAEWGRTQKPSPQPKGNTEEFDDYNPALLG